MIDTNFKQSVVSCSKYNPDDPRWECIEGEEDKGFEYEKDIFSNMINSLDYNYCFDMGFKIIYQTSETNNSCLCPCCPIMNTWKTQNGMSSLGGYNLNCELEGYVTPINLVRHLVQMKKILGFMLEF